MAPSVIERSTDDCGKNPDSSRGGAAFINYGRTRRQRHIVHNRDQYSSGSGAQ